MASKTLLVLTLITTFLETLLYSGVVYGWTSIHKVFVQEGFFLPQNSTASSTASSVQNSQLSLVFTVSTSVAPVANFFTGALLDCKGIWKTRTLLLILQCVGYLLIALVGASFSRILFLAVPLLDIGGYGMLTVNSQISNLYPRYRSAVITTLCGCFISSSVVFWVFKVFYLSFGFSLKSILLCAASFSVLLHLRTFLLMPRHTVPEILPPDFKYGYHELHKANKTSHKTKAKDLDANSNSIKGVRRTFTQNLFTKKTLTNIFHFCILQLGLIFFIGNFNSIITRVVPNNKVSFHTQIYAIIQSCGVLICPICGVLMDRLHFALQSSNNKKTAGEKLAAFFMLFSNISCLCLFLSSSISSEPFCFLTYFFVLLSRSVLYGSLGSNIAILYPAEHFGKMYGISVALGGLFLFANYPINLAVTRYFEGNFVYANYAFACLCLLTLLLPASKLYELYVVLPKQRRLKKEEVNESNGKLLTRR